MNSANEYASLLAQTEESLRWLSECGVDAISVPEGWQIPRLMPSQLRESLMPDDSAVVDAIGENGVSPPKLSQLLHELGSGETGSSQRARRSSDQGLAAPKNIRERPVFASFEVETEVETFLEEEAVVDASLRNHFKRVLSFESLKADYAKPGICPVCNGSQEAVVPTMGRECRAVFIADQPDERELLMGVPYVGETGSLVARMVKAMGLSREEVGFAYVNSCSHSEASADELAEHWQPLLDRYLALAQPEVIVAFGECAARRLTGQTVAFPHLRGQWFEYQGTPVLSTFHPTALIQHPAGKSVVWGDLKNVMRKMGLSVPKR